MRATEDEHNSERAFVRGQHSMRALSTLTRHHDHDLYTTTSLIQNNKSERHGDSSPELPSRPVDTRIRPIVKIVYPATCFALAGREHAGRTNQQLCERSSG